MHIAAASAAVVLITLTLGAFGFAVILFPKATLIVPGAVAVVRRNDLGIAAAGGPVVRVTIRASLPADGAGAVIAGLALRIAERAVLLFIAGTAQGRACTAAIGIARNDVRVLAAGGSVVREARGANFPAHGAGAVIA